ncbi:MAG: type I DNA topoisomerase [Thermodesulfobacteriota bacterium]
MSKPLIIVESPTKVKTLKKYLGNDYAVEATVGHILDLPAKELGIDVEKDFTPSYQPIAGKSKVISRLKKAASDADTIYLAPDPDREGEAIAWHAAQVLQKKGRVFHRVLFHELTKTAIEKAMAHPLELSASKYDAQKTRRILDRLVGYMVSPLLWRKVKGGLSAGRVQTVALRMICEREKEIRAFVPQEYWTITALLSKQGAGAFSAKLKKKSGKNLEIKDGETAQKIVDELSQSSYTVADVQKKRVRKNPFPPFTTSKMQQEAIRKLRFSARKTMSVAQQLYEGVELSPGDIVGLITYMRTDSTRIANEAAEEALSFIGERFGKDYRPDSPRFFKNKKNVQDAHEAIRPTSVANTPDKVAPYLSDDQAKLYRLIWQRFVASQMQPAQFDQTSVSVAAGPYELTASGSILVFDGFMALYQVADDEEDKDLQKLPDLAKQDPLALKKLDPKQHFTQPPPRFSEASLVKALEENGIGRPSTYAAILSTIRDKDYVALVKGYFHPSELGMLVNDILVANFAGIFDVAFTATMEDKLDDVETARIPPQSVLAGFYESFSKDLERASKQMVSIKGVGIPSGLSCPRCEKPLHIKVGKNGPFLACSGYPACTYASDYARDEKGNVKAAPPPEPPADAPEAEPCDKCGKPMVVRQGKYGPFYACSGYPKCKNTRSMNGASGEQATGVNCPREACQGKIVEKKSKRGKLFYGCSRFPDCDYATWDKPVPEPCPNCGSPFLTEKTSKKEGTFLSCPNPDCSYKKTLPKEEPEDK